MALRIWLHSLQRKVVSGDNMVTSRSSSNKVTHYVWEIPSLQLVHYMTVGTTSRVHGFISLPTVPLPKQTHQETTTSIILSNRKRMEEWNRKSKETWKNILKIYFMCPNSSIFIQLAFQIAQPWVGPSQWLQAHPARKVADLCWVAFRNLARRAWFARFQICVLGWFLLHRTVYSKMPPSELQFVMLLCHKLWTGGKGSLQLLAPNWLFPFSISKCRSLGKYCDGNYMKTAARTAWTSAHEFSCLVCITSNHIGKMLGYFSTTRVGQCHCPHRFRCVAQWPHQKMHFGFSVSMRRLTKFRPRLNTVAAVGLATWKCDAMVLCCASVTLWKV